MKCSSRLQLLILWGETCLKYGQTTYVFNRSICKVVVTSLCFYVKQFNINFHKNRTTFTAMFHEEHTSQNELLLEKGKVFYKYLCSWNNATNKVHKFMEHTKIHLLLTSTCFSPLRPSSGVEVKVKVKFTPEQATKAQTGRKGIALLFLQPWR